MAWVDDKLVDITQSPAVAAMLGSMLSLKWMPVGSTWLNRLNSLAGGIGTAVYIIPWFVVQAGIESKRAELAFSFIGGFLGLLILSRAWEYVARTNFGELVSSIFRRSEQ